MKWLKATKQIGVVLLLAALTLWTSLSLGQLFAM